MENNNDGQELNDDGWIMTENNIGRGPCLIHVHVYVIIIFLQYIPHKLTVGVNNINNSGRS